MSREIEELKDAAGDYKRWALEARKKHIELRLRQNPEIRGLYIRAADRVAQELRRLALKTPSSYLRKRQLEELEAALRMEAARLGGNLTKALETYIEEAVNAGAGYSQAVTMDLFKKAGIDTTGLRALFARVNTQAVEACWIRTKNGLFLSDRIWEKSEKFRATMRDLMQESVATGQDAVKTARMLQQYVRQGAQTLARDYPNMMKRMKGRVPGDICYEALRLARTETTAAFGEGTIAAAKASPSYKGIKWILSKSHPLVDICDSLAGHEEGLGTGVYTPGNEPPYPAHPSCLCVLVPVHEEPTEFVERLKRWKENPESVPNIEKWYQQVYKGEKSTTASVAIQNPAFLRFEKYDKNYDDFNDVKQIEKDLGLIPESHKELLKQHGVVIRTGYDKSRYDRKNKVIQVGKNPEYGEVVHEIGHAVETLLNLYASKGFLNILKNGIPEKDIGYHHIFISNEFVVPVYVLKHPEITKFVNTRQAVIYPRDINGNGWFVTSSTGEEIFNVCCLGEYFAEGYRVFISDPGLLKKKDPQLYRFVEELSK